MNITFWFWLFYLLYACSWIKVQINLLKSWIERGEVNSENDPSSSPSSLQSFHWQRSFIRWELDSCRLKYIHISLIFIYLFSCVFIITSKKCMKADERWEIQYIKLELCVKELCQIQGQHFPPIKRGWIIHDISQCPVVGYSSWLRSFESKFLTTSYTKLLFELNVRFK